MDKKIILLVIFFDMSIACMESNTSKSCSMMPLSKEKKAHKKKAPSNPMMLLSEDIAHNKIAPLLSLQSIAYLRRTSKGCKKLYNVHRVCPFFRNSTCSTLACSVLEKNYYACTKALAHCAKIKDEEMFIHWWAYHAVVRHQNLFLLIKRNDASVKDRMKAYRTYCSTAKKTRNVILKDAQRALNRKDPSIVKTIFDGSNLNIFDLIKEDYEPFGDPYIATDITLYDACQLNDFSLVQSLCGGTVDSKWIQLIMSYSSSYVVCGLIKTGALTIDTFDRSKKTVLHYAAQYNLYEVIKILLESGVYVNCTDARRMTPLHYAVKNRHVQSVKALLESNDADVRFTNRWGKTVLDYITHAGWEDGDDRDNRRLIKGLLETHVEQNLTHGKHAKISKEGYYKI